MFKNDKLIIKLFILLSAALFFSVNSIWLTHIFDKYFVDKVLFVFYQNEVNLLETFLVSVISFYSLYLIITKIEFTKYKVKWWIIPLFFFLIALYLNERIFINKYEFTRIFNTQNTRGIPVLDLAFVILGLLTVTLFVNILEVNQKNHHNSLLLDEPIDTIENDQYFRKHIYDNLIYQIRDLKNFKTKSFSIGLVNKWGEGKTSLLNLLERELINDKHTTLIKFNPWFNAHSDGLTNDFFKTLDKYLSKYVWTGGVLKKYASNLTQINSIYNPTKYLPHEWLNYSSNDEYYLRIKKWILNTNRRFFIFIDDIDRLDYKEVFNVFRLIRVSANFPNLIFIVPFDKDYILGALKENKLHSPEEYIKKMFDVEISLTPINDSYLTPIIRNNLIEFVKNKIALVSDKDNDEFENQILAATGTDTFNKKSSYPKYNIIRKFLFKWITNKRDVIRLTNAIKISLSNNLQVLYIPDVIILELIKAYDLKLYRRIFENRDYLIDVEEEEGRRAYKLYKEGDKNEDAYSFLGSLTEKNDLSKEIDSDLIPLLESLFSKPEESDHNQNLSIYYGVNFLNYIQHTITGISYDSIENMLNGD